MCTKVQSVVVPWRTPEQFRKVYEYLYSDDISCKCWAVEQIGVWQSRCWPSLPGAVEVCQLLAKATIHDLLYETQKSLCRAREIEMMFGMGIIRFVNVAVERDQIGKGKITMTDLAEKHNIPPWIVSIRHDASHGLYPTLPVLRMATESILEYYKKVFWEPECSRITPVVRECDETEMIVLIEKYRTIQHEFIRNKYNTHLSGKLRKKVIAKIDLLLRKPELKRKFLEIITHPDRCVTQEDVNLALISDADFAEDSKQDLVCILPQALQRFWTPLIELLQKRSCVSTFLEQLQLSQEKRKIKIFQKVVDYLVIYILDMRKFNAPLCSLKSHFSKKGPMINFKRLLFCCMKGSSTYSRVVFERIIQEIPLGDWKNELIVLLSIKQGLTLKDKNGKLEKQKSEKSKLDPEFTYAIPDLEDDLNSILKKKRNASLWSSPSITMDFSLEPLGTIHHPFERKEEKLTDEKENIEIKIENLENVTSDVNEDVEMTNVAEDSTPQQCILKDISLETFDVIYKKRDKK